MKKIWQIVPVILLMGFFRQGISQVPELKVQTARQFLEYFSSGRAAESYELLDPSVRSKISVEQMEQLWQSIEFQMGELESTGAVRTEIQERYEFVYIPCVFAHTSVDLRVVFPASGELITGFFFSPPATSASYTKPSYAEGLDYTEINTDVVTDTFRLPATLMLPPGEDPFPLVILVHGSGPADRNASLGPNKIFADLAYGLASEGIATLRYEKRTRVYGTDLDVNSLTLYGETIQDALSAIDSLREHPSVDPEKIYVLGHSLGAYAAPWIADLAGDRIAGIILMAANASPLEDLVLEQYRYLYALDGISQKEKENLDVLEEQVQRVKSRKLDEDIPAVDLPLGAPAAYWIGMKKYDPVKKAKKLRIPVLILQGERDYQVPLSEYEKWKKGLEKEKHVTFRLFSGLNHLFLKGEGPSEPEEYLIPGHVPMDVISFISDWIL